jgi:hypothetical protein
LPGKKSFRAVNQAGYLVEMINLSPNRY